MSEPTKSDPTAVRVSRRRAIQAGTAATVLPLLPVTASLTSRAQADPATLPTFNLSDAVFSVAERDRRWAAVRAIMGRPTWNLDAIITAASDQDGNYARYLTQIGNRPGSGDGPEMLFTRDSAQPVYVQVGSGRNRALWSERLRAWISDGKLIIDQKGGAKALAEQMIKLGLNKAGVRIGVARLAGSRFEPEGLVSQTFMDMLRAALPGATFLAIDKWGPDAGPVEEVAMIKSAEEHATIRRAVAASEAGLAAMITALRSGAARQCDIWFPAYSAMFAHTGEDPTRLSISLDQPANSTIGMPVSQALKPGQIINQEIDGTAQGYRAQVNHSVFVGGPSTPGYDYYRTAMAVAIGIVNDAIGFIQPGKTTYGDLVKHYVARLEEAGAEDTAGVMVHSSGIGNLSRPRLGPDNSTGDLPIVIQPGMTFDLKPQFRMKRDRVADVGARNRDIQLGEHLLVTETGVVRLGKRELVPIVTQS